MTTIDMHTGGEPLRIITGGLPDLPGRTVLERRRYFRDHFDTVRTRIMWEPRGHGDMYGAVITPPDDQGADFGVFFMHNEGYSTMCGHAVLALARYAYDQRLAAGTQMRIDVPAGRVEASVQLVRGKYAGSSFRNVPSFVYLNNGRIDLQGYGTVHFDLAFGGAFYALIDADQAGISLNKSDAFRLVELGSRIKQEISRKYRIVHPFEEDLSFLYGTIFSGSSGKPGHHSRNVCIFADGELDRSATGSGVSARAALMDQQGLLKPGERITIESISGSTMDVEIAGAVPFGPYHAVIPQVSAKAFYTGEHRFIFEEDDVMKDGFLLK